MVGKVSTVVQVLYIALVLLLLTMNEPPPVIEQAGEAVVTLLTVWSFLAYGHIWLKAAFRRVPQGNGTV
jgi:cardiolipin synthase